MNSVTNFAKSSTSQFCKRSVNLNNIYFMEDTEQVFDDEPLTTKNAVKFLLDGTLKFKVCRYCLKTTSPLSELDEILEVGINGSLHEIAIKDMVASFHPVKVTGDPNLPNKICKECLKQTMSSYFYVQQCERAERALRNCFDDIYDKFLKLDPSEPVKKRGKRKLNPNPNRIYTEHKNAIDYAEPLIHIINTNSVPPNDTTLNPLECKKCWQVLPNVESLVNHEKSHPASMWYHCKLCGKSFVKKFHLKKHFKESHGLNANKTESFVGYKCHQCDFISKCLGRHLQHIEKHKFKVQFEHFMGNKMDELCAVCLDESTKMVNFNEVVYLSGGYPGLTGDQSIYNIISKTFTSTFNMCQESLNPEKPGMKPITTIKKKKKINCAYKLHNFLSLNPLLCKIITMEHDDINNSFLRSCIYIKDIRIVCGSKQNNNLSKKLKVNTCTESNHFYNWLGKAKIENSHRVYIKEDTDKNCKICWIFKNTSCKCCHIKVDGPNIFESSKKQIVDYTWVFSKIKGYDCLEIDRNN